MHGWRTITAGSATVPGPVIEPLAKAGTRVVVATMGLAAGINFSLRSVALAADSYRRDHLEIPLMADEIHQCLAVLDDGDRRGRLRVGFSAE